MQLAVEVPVVGAVVGQPVHELEEGEGVAGYDGRASRQEQLAVHEAEEGRDVVVLHLLRR